ncbi:MAG: hypothetical protein ABR926_27575 [Streptosporangiaceae bacterium]
MDRSSLPELRPPGARLVAYLHLAFPLLRPFGRRPGEAAASLERRDERYRRPRTAHVRIPPLLRETAFRRYWGARSISLSATRSP